MKVALTTARIEAAKPRAKPYEVRDATMRGLLLRVGAAGAGGRGGGKTFYYQYRRPDGRQVNLKLGPAGIGVAEARRLAQEAAAAVARGEDPQGRRQEERGEARRAGERTLEALLAGDYGAHAQAHQRRGDETVARVRSAFRDWLGRDVAAITGWEVERWRAARLKGGARRATVDRDIVALRGVLALARRAGLLVGDPLVGVKRLERDRAGRVRFLSDEEEARLRAAMRDRDAAARARRAGMNGWLVGRARDGLPGLPEPYADHIEPMVLVLLNTGIRFGEATALRWGDVDLAGRMLTVRGETAKAGVTRHIPLNAEAVEVLSAWRAQGAGSGLVFPGRGGAPLVDVKTAWVRLLARAGVGGFRLHDLRHTFASRLVQRGVSLLVVQRLLGHAGPEMTLRYAHLAPDNLAAAVAVLGRGPVEVVPLRAAV